MISIGTQLKILGVLLVASFGFLPTNLSVGDVYGAEKTAYATIASAKKASVACVITQGSI